MSADALIAAIDDSAPFMPRFAAQMAALLNAVALAVTPDAAAAFFPSPFANLPFAGKARVFQFMDCNDAYKAMSEALPALVDALIDADVEGSEAIEDTDLRTEQRRQRIGTEAS